MKVVLYQPEIPQNTGNIVRTCAMTGSDLLLVRPLGFSTSDRMLKRAGLDYWYRVRVEFTDDLVSHLETCNCRFFFFSSKVKARYSDISYQESDYLIFGSETAGLPAAYFERWPDLFYTIPTLSLLDSRAASCQSAEIPGPWQANKRTQDSGCLNLSNAVSIVVYEALRQREFNTLV